MSESISVRQIDGSQPFEDKDLESAAHDFCEQILEGWDRGGASSLVQTATWYTTKFAAQFVEDLPGTRDEMVKMWRDALRTYTKGNANECDGSKEGPEQLDLLEPEDET